MTNLDAIRALCTKICSGFYPDQNVLEFTLLDNGIDPSKNFIPKDVELVKAAISVVKGMTENSHRKVEFLTGGMRIVLIKVSPLFVGSTI